MKARAAAGGIIASAAILALGWHLGSEQVTAASGGASPAAGTSTAGGTGGSGSATTTGPTSPTAAPTASATPSSGAASSGTASVSGTFDGTTAETQYGPVQVEVVVANGKITDVKALQLTDRGGRSVQISNQAAPILRTEALSAQSAHISSVSGATYTSEGYTTSLQSALDKAGL